MKLNDLRKYAIRRQETIRFRIANGSECVIDRQGVLRIPGLDAPPDFQVADQLDEVDQFELENAGNLSRVQVEKLVAAGPVEAVADHDE